MKIDEALKRRFGSITLPFGASSRASPARNGSFPTAKGGREDGGETGRAARQARRMWFRSADWGQEATSVY